MADSLAATRTSPGDSAATARNSVQKALAVVRACSERLNVYEGCVAISFADAPGTTIYVSCPGGNVTSHAPSDKVRVGIAINSFDLILIAEGKRHPRSLFGFARTFSVDGAIPDAMHFLDALQGVDRRQPAYDPAILPVATPDMSRAKSDFERFGYCLLEGAISPQTTAKLRQRLLDQAAGERAAGVATFDGGRTQPNQRVWHLPNKGQEFIDLLNEPVIDAFFPELLGPNYLVCSYSANIAGKGGDPMYLHYDQGQIDPPLPGTMLGLNIAFFLDDVSDANGGTRIMPGSVGDGFAPDDPTTINGTVAAEGPAGTALIWDSRVWHGTGTNTTDKPRHVILLYCIRFFLRQQDNYALLLRDDVKAGLSDRVKTMLGFRVTNSLGGIGNAEGTFVERSVEPMGRMAPL